MDLPNYIEPSFNLKSIKVKLMNTKTPLKTKMSLILGLHYKFWHASVPDLKRMFLRGCYGAGNIRIFPEAIKLCHICANWARVPHKPTSSVHLATYFNQRVQTDLFTIWGKWYVIWIDEAVRWCLVSPISNRTAEEWTRLFFWCWIRMFGPCKYLVSDQEKAVVSDLCGSVCDRFNIKRDSG